MIPHETLDKLANLHSPNGNAVSFYYRRERLQNLAHQNEPIVVKDKVRELLVPLRELHDNKSREDLEKILKISEELATSTAAGKAIFACSGQDFWWEMDVDEIPETRIAMGSYFELLPLLASQNKKPRCCIVVLDREKTRVFKMQGSEIGEYSWIIDEDEDWRVRNTGAKGSSHMERQREDKVKHHFTFVADHLQYFLERDDYDLLIIGTRDELWPEIEAKLHPDLQRVLIGRFHADPGLISMGEVEEKARQILEERHSVEIQDSLQKIYSEVQRNGAGAIGIHNVVNALEKGEVQTLYLSDMNPGPAAQCTNCGHITVENTAKCEVCNHETIVFGNAAECLLRKVITTNHIDLEVLLEHPQLQGIGGVAARLRFRADQSTAQKLAS